MTDVGLIRVLHDGLELVAARQLLGDVELEGRAFEGLRGMRGPRAAAVGCIGRFSGNCRQPRQDLTSPDRGGGPDLVVQGNDVERFMLGSTVNPCFHCVAAGCLAGL